MIRHYKNAAWSVAEGIGYPLLLLAATPLLLKSLGPAGFGLWTLLITISSLGMVVGIGLSPAVIKLVAEFSAPSNKKIAEIARGAMAVAFFAGGFMALLVVCLTCALATSWLAKLGSPQVVIVTGIVSALILWIEQFDLVISSVIKGLEEFSLAARLEICLKLSQIAAVILTAVLSGSVQTVFAVFLALAAVRLGLKAVFLKRRFPEISLVPKLAFAAPVLHISKWGWVQGLGSIFFMSADRLIIGAALGPVSLGYYSIAVQMVSQSHALVANAFSTIVPRVSKLGVVRGPAALKSMTIKLSCANIFVAAVAAILLWQFGPALLTLWVGPDVASHVGDVLLILVGAYFVLSSGIVPFFVLTGLGAMKTIAIACIAGGTATLALTLLLVPVMGNQGAAWARLGYAFVALVLYIPVMLSWRMAPPVVARPRAEKLEPAYGQRPE